MKKFQFSLQGVLNWREILYEREQSLLQSLLSEQARLTELQRGLEQELQMGYEHAQYDGMELHRRAAYRDHLRSRIADVHELSARRRTEVDLQRAKCVEFGRKHKALENLKGARYADWKQEMELETERIASELFLANRSRVRRS